MYKRQEEFNELKDAVLQLIKRLRDIDLYEMTEAVKQIATYKLSINDYFDLMMVWYRDVLLFKATGDVNGLIFKDEVYLSLIHIWILDFVEKGDLIRIKNGYYAVRLSDFSEEELIARLFPDCVLNLETALYAYGYLNRKPYGYKLSVDKNTSKSRFKLDFPPVVPLYAEPETLTLGAGSYTHLDVYKRQPRSR